MMSRACAASVDGSMTMGRLRHDVAGRQREQSVVVDHVPAEVAVGDDADELVCGIDDARHAERFLRDLGDDVAHRRVGLDDRRIGAAVHQLIDAHQLLAQLAARMNLGEVLFAESLFDEQRHAQRVAHRERGGRAGGGHEIERTRFFRHLAVERDVGRLRERRCRIAGDRDDVRADAADRLEQAQHFLRFAAVRNRQQQVARLNDAEIAVRRFRGMKKERRRAGARQRRGDFAADDAGLAHARDDDAPLAFEEHAYRAVEVLVEAIDERQDGRSFGLQDLARERAVGRCLGLCHSERVN